MSEFIKYLDRVFDMLLFTELFDESLVLLRRRLHWKTKDIVYMKVNVFKQKVKAPWASRKEYPAYVMQKFARFAALDIALYDFFFDKFRKQIENQGEDFQDEVSAFKKLNTLVA